MKMKTAPQGAVFVWFGAPQDFPVSAMSVAMVFMLRAVPDRAADPQSWWAVTDSNRRHPACKAGALPTELTALNPRQYRVRAVQCKHAGQPTKHTGRWGPNCL